MTRAATAMGNRDIEALRAAFRARYGEFLEREVHAERRSWDHDRAPVPRDTLARAAAMGLLREGAPESLGGQGRSPLEWGVLLEEMAYLGGDAGFASLVSLAVSNAVFLEQNMPDGAGRRLAAAILDGEQVCSFAYTDHSDGHPGADPFNFSSKATRSPGGWTIEGHKPIVAGARLADLFVAYIADETSGDLLTFLLKRSDEGLYVREVDTLGLRSFGVGALEMRGLFVADDRLLVKADGLSVVQRFLNSRRAVLAATFVGGMRRALEEVVGHIAKKERYGTAMTDLQAVQSKVGKMYVALESSRALLYRALGAMSEGTHDEHWDPLVTAAKYHCVRSAVEMATTIVGLVGTEGYLMGRGWDQLLRDFIGGLGTAGAQDVIEVDLGVREIARIVGW